MSAKWEAQIRNEVYDIVQRDNYLSWECHDEMAMRAVRAIKRHSLDGFFDRMVLFKPDDAGTDHDLEIHSEEDVKFYMERYGALDYVMKHLYDEPPVE